MFSLIASKLRAFVCVNCQRRRGEKQAYIIGFCRAKGGVNETSADKNLSFQPLGARRITCTV